MSKMTVYIDESGTLPDPADKVVVVAAVGTDNPMAIHTFLQKIKKKAVLRQPNNELKFYTAGEKTKLLFFTSIVKQDFVICALTVDKMGKKIADTPEHYAALCLVLLSDVLQVSSHVHDVVFDRHFTSIIDIEKFNTIIATAFTHGVSIHHVDSKQDKRVNVADMIAGAVLAKETGRNERFYAIMKRKIYKNRKITWTEVKRRLMNRKKLA